MHCTFQNYRAECATRYTSHFTFRDARSNWRHFEDHRETFTAWLRHFRRDPLLYVGDKSHNPSGTLTDMCWVMQLAIEPDRSRLSPCLDFEEHYQKVFLRRGLVTYLKLLLRDLEATNAPDPGQIELLLLFSPQPSTLNPQLTKSTCPP